MGWGSRAPGVVVKILASGGTPGPVLSFDCVDGLTHYPHDPLTIFLAQVEQSILESGEVSIVFKASQKPFHRKACVVCCVALLGKALFPPVTATSSNPTGGTLKALRKRLFV